MSSEDIGFLSIAELGRRYRNGTLRPADVVKHALAKLEQLEPVLKAFADPMAAQAIAEAERAGAELAAGHDRGPLHGIPVAIKDLIEVAGVPTGYARACVRRSLP
jgi:aspartyl-tRNA(Asn)/glutamyl-tRNA(Gln) amidotransferase subunit A